MGKGDIPLWQNHFLNKHMTYDHVYYNITFLYDKYGNITNSSFVDIKVTILKLNSIIVYMSMNACFIVWLIRIYFS